MDIQTTVIISSPEDLASLPRNIPAQIRATAASPRGADAAADYPRDAAHESKARNLRRDPRRQRALSALRDRQEQWKNVT